MKRRTHNVLYTTFFLCLALFIHVHTNWFVETWQEVQAYIAAPIDTEFAVVPITLGNVSLNAIVADTEEKRIKGLSGRKSLSSKQAMLFIFDKPDRYGIWMRDMTFPIDIVWIDQNMRVITVVSRAQPDSFPNVFEPTDDALYIVELKAGFADENNINIGDPFVMFR
jgi:uncharacterized protein